MRIRQVRPEFFTDPLTSKLPVDVRLTYIGLWCVADDAGWLTWDASHVAAVLYPYESVLVRERRVNRAGEALIAAGRIVLHDCGCAHIPTLEGHQKIGGNKSFVARDRHQSRHSRTSPPGKLGNGSNGTLVAPASADALARLRDEEDAELIARVRQRRGLTVAQ